MRYVLLTLLLAAGIIASTASPARADTVVFPPLGCSGDAQYITWLNGNATHTTCQSGQQILSNAIPACAAGQDVAFDGIRFYCKSPASVPTCGANEFLSFNGTSYECRNAGIPACGSNQVLTFNGTNYYCVNRTDSIPTCGTNQFLTYNGGYQCATVNTTTIPACTADQLLTADGANLVCVNKPQPSIAMNSANLAIEPAAHYVDCDPGYTAIACTSVVVPSGAHSCQVTPGVTDPNTQKSSCAQGGCTASNPGDYAYYTTATCLRLQ